PGPWPTNGRAAACGATTCHRYTRPSSVVCSGRAGDHATASVPMTRTTPRLASARPDHRRLAHVIAPAESPRTAPRDPVATRAPIRHTSATSAAAYDLADFSRALVARAAPRGTDNAMRAPTKFGLP